MSPTLFPRTAYLSLVYRVSEETPTLDAFLRGDPEARRELFQEWEMSPERARLSSNAIDAGFKIRPTEAELKEMGPEFNDLWNRYFKDKPDKVKRIHFHCFAFSLMNDSL